MKRVESFANELEKLLKKYNLDLGVQEVGGEESIVITDLHSDDEYSMYTTNAGVHLNKISDEDED